MVNKHWQEWQLQKVREKHYATSMSVSKVDNSSKSKWPQSARTEGAETLFQFA